uniref:Uncharacterized protein n=1 Tax=Davidia involucrata TaxID=16924 RepID=A0A5B7BVE2_DAVIN
MGHLQKERLFMGEMDAYIQDQTEKLLGSKNSSRLQLVLEENLKSERSSKRVYRIQKGNGRDPYLWYDPWHPSGILAEICGYESTPQAKVSNIIEGSEWKWPRRLHGVRDMTNFSPNTNCEDQIVCTLDSSGEYSVAAGWNRIGAQ